LLLEKYGFDWFNERVFMNGSKRLGTFFYRAGDQVIIDGALVNGTTHLINWLSRHSRTMQNGHLYSYVLVMMLGLFGFLVWFCC
jgi:NADH-quinone oxidoreductase subunit L